MKKINNKERVAYHEAGHAIIGFFLRMDRHPKIKFVTIIPDKKQIYLGCVQEYSNKLNRTIEDGVSPSQQRIIENLIISLYAGMIAEKIFTGRYNHLGASLDRKHAILLAGYVAGGGKSLKKYLSWLHNVSENNVNSRWKYIEKCAKELIIKKTLYFGDLIKLTQP